jgi:ribosomal protein S18 acetylase RimI-like enzyme
MRKAPDQFGRKIRIAGTPLEHLIWPRRLEVLRDGSMHPLDNPIFNALRTCQAHFAETYQLLWRFPPEVTPLGGFVETNEAGIDSLRGYLASGGALGILVPAKIDAPRGLEIILEGPLLQMILENASDLPGIEKAHDFIELREADVPEMVALATLTKPGPFGTRTREMGTYLGIRKDGMLAAMAGERMKLPGYTEISAVCTHPDHLGHGYAGFLMTILAQRIRARGEVPFLHVRPENTRAVHLYERLGFTRRLLYHYVVFRAAKPEEVPTASMQI